MQGITAQTMEVPGFVNSRTGSRLVRSDTIPNDNFPATVLITRSSKLHDAFYVAIPASKTPAYKLPNSNATVYKKSEPLLKVTGNILYDVNYRSRIDTPYAENNVYQHTLQTRLDLLYKGQYPFRIYLTTRFSNSSLFRDYTDLNFQFNPSDFKRIVNQKLLNAAQSYLASRSGKLDSLRHLIEAKKLAISSLYRALQKPDLTQKIIEEREKQLFNKPAMQFPSDTSSGMMKITGVAGSEKSKANAEITKYKDSLETGEQKLDSLVAELGQIEKLYNNLRSAEHIDLTELKKQIEGTKNLRALEDKLQQLNLPDTILPKGYKTLYSIQSLRIGRSIADYSELSVKDISITGIQVEYNPRFYYALAVGRVDYRFRDYIVPDNSRSNQYVALVRFGKGTKNGNHIFFTYYTGRRQFFSSSVTTQVNDRVPGYNLGGITIEGVYRISRNVSIIGEIAKSTIPYHSLDSLQRKEWMNSVSKFSDRSNEAYSVKLYSFFPKTLTRINANLRYTGAHFQSFSTFTTGASQLRWMAKLEQPFFKKQLTVTSSIQQNDYNNPFVATAYKSSSLLASIQANLRVKKWPVISAGYYPSYQLIKTGNDHYTESRYYVLNASAGYYYKIKDVQLNSYLVFSRFYNESGDSGFVYYNSKNLLLSHSIFLTGFSTTLNASLSTSTDYNIYSIENNNQVTISKRIAIGGGVKLFRYSLTPSLQWGYNGNVTINIPGLGQLQFLMDRGFIPGLSRQLVENKMGRLTYYKTF
jgi:hypothetical protein